MRRERETGEGRVDDPYCERYSNEARQDDTGQALLPPSPSSSSIPSGAKKEAKKMKHTRCIDAQQQQPEKKK
jgi:hypothetical protein